METITSVNNKIVRHLALLETKARERKKSRSFIIEGERIVRDSLKELPPGDVLGIYVTQELAGRSPDLPAGVGAYRVVTVTEEVFRKISGTQSPQGILAEVRIPEYSLADVIRTPEGRAPLLVMTEDVQDPGNLGTMIRTAEAAGVTGMILSEGTADPTNPKVVRATMSALFRMKYAVVPDFAQALASVRAAGIRIYAAALEGSRLYDSCSYRGGTAFLIGNEGNGLSAETLAAADGKIRIPMEGRIESLNAAMSAGILMYEAARQRRAGKEL